MNKADFLGKYPSWTSEASGSACSEKYRDRDGLQVALCLGTPYKS